MHCQPQETSPLLRNSKRHYACLHAWDAFCFTFLMLKQGSSCLVHAIPVHDYIADLYDSMEHILEAFLFI
jgi:hypothetical protein